MNRLFPANIFWTRVFNNTSVYRVTVGLYLTSIGALSDLVILIHGVPGFCTAYFDHLQKLEKEIPRASICSSNWIPNWISLYVVLQYAHKIGSRIGLVYDFPAVSIHLPIFCEPVCFTRCFILMIQSVDFYIEMFHHMFS